MIKIWVNGCFDVLHIGHIRLLQYAKSLGDYVRVGIDSDERVSQLKGPDRPVHNQEMRLEVLKEMISVDDVVVFNSDEELENEIKQYAPSLIVIGDDYRHEKVIGAEYANDIRFFNKIPGHSSSEIIKNINEEN